MCLLVLFLGFLKLDLVNFDAILGVLEVEIDGKRVGVVDLLTLGVFGQRAELGAGQGLKSAFDFGFGCDLSVRAFAEQSVME